VVEGFARQSGGYLNITSAAGEGTTISVALPVADEALELMPPPTALQMPPDDGKQIG